ncbi:MAG: peptide chain release factor N(5)-glutamine methyltransferase [Eubacteriales bacterium]|nr:peptide chain release factor N(5)-glutamine methyltransferase [Eubacteriales bacterium]
MNCRELLQNGRNYLESCNVPDSDVDAWLLFEFVTGIDRTHYFLRQTEECDTKWQEKYEELIEKRGQHIPLQHLTGQQEFMGFPFRVNEHVLIPRQDTELLVTEALKRIKAGNSVLDMCTGSGCIIISLQKLCGSPKGRYVAVDISEEALLTAEENAAGLGADVEFVRSDLFEKVDGRYDCIVSNPPYIKSGEIGKLMPEVKDHEPVLALDGLEDGLYFYRRIIKDAARYLKSGGWLLFEIGFDQGKAVSELMEEQGYTELEIKKDLAGLDRVVIGKSR